MIGFSFKYSTFSDEEIHDAFIMAENYEQAVAKLYQNYPVKNIIP